MDTSVLSTWKKRFDDVAKENILHFWLRHGIDRENGGFYGIVDNDLRIDRTAPKMVVINARALWTFATAYRLFGDPAYLDAARWSYQFLLEHFWDRRHGGLFWQVDYRGNALNPRKQIYGLAFGIYGLSEYYRVTGDMQSLEKAIELFDEIETHGHDPQYGGYIEALAHDWQALDDVRLSHKDMNSPKSMNTLLHVLEAYTNLLRVWRNEKLKSQQEHLLEIFLHHVIANMPYPHLSLFFDKDWTLQSDHISFGHDIEASWLLFEAAEVLENPALLERVHQASLKIVQAVYEHGRAPDGSLFYEANPAGIVNYDRHWWPQAEAVIGFMHGYQLSEDERYLDASYAAWSYIERYFIDHKDGEWFGVLDPQGMPYPTTPDNHDTVKIGPWKCPYHNARTCYEGSHRLQKILCRLR